MSRGDILFVGVVAWGNLTYAWFSDLFGLPPASLVTPLKPEQFARELANHPNQAQVTYVLDGIRKGLD